VVETALFSIAAFMVAAEAPVCEAAYTLLTLSKVYLSFTANFIVYTGYTEENYFVCHNILDRFGYIYTLATGAMAA